MERASLAQKKDNNAIIAAVVRTVDCPVQDPASRKNDRSRFGVVVRWLRSAWQRERERRELTKVRGPDFGDLPVPPSLVLDELRRWPWQKSSPLWATLVRRRRGDGLGVTTERPPISKLH